MGQKSTRTWVIEVIEFKFEVISDLQGHVEVIMASEATKMALRRNLHMDTMVKEDA